MSIGIILIDSILFTIVYSSVNVVPVLDILFCSYSLVLYVVLNLKFQIVFGLGIVMHA